MVTLNQYKKYTSAEMVQWIMEVSAKNFKLPCGTVARTHSFGGGRRVGGAGWKDGVGEGRKAAEIIPYPAPLS